MSNKVKWILSGVVGLVGAIDAGVVTNFYADFQGAANGTIVNAASLNAGTEAGSWSVAALEESYFATNAAGNRRLALDQGAYSVLANLASVAEVSKGVEFSIDFRNLRDGTVKYNEIRLQNSSGLNLVSFRLEPTTSSESDKLYIWNGSQWTQVTTISNNLPSVPDETGMQTLRVSMTGTDFDVFLDGTEILSNYAYVNTGDLTQIRLSGVSTASGVWYDNISVTTIPEPTTVGLFTISSAGILMWRRMLSR